MLDLMAAVPSVVFGLWGSYLLQWKILPVLALDQRLVLLDSRCSR